MTAVIGGVRLSVREVPSRISPAGGMMRLRRLDLPLLAAAILVSGGACRRSDDSVRPGPIPASLVPSRTLPSSSALLALGKKAYAKECLACHGATGDGEGEAAYLLYPRPRDFTSGQFRLVSTWDSIPTDEDLFRTISRGMPGSAMPSWGHLSEETRWGLLHYVKSFSKRPLEVNPSREPDADGNGGAGVVKVPAEPPYDGEAEARARSIFAKSCAPCHGPSGKGDGQQEHPTPLDSVIDQVGTLPGYQAEAFASLAIIFISLTRSGRLRGRNLLVGGAFYLAYLAFVVAVITGIVGSGG